MLLSMIYPIPSHQKLPAFQIQRSDFQNENALYAIKVFYQGGRICSFAYSIGLTRFSGKNTSLLALLLELLSA